MQQTEVMEKSKEELMEELMAELKEDLAKGRKQVAAKEDIVVNVVKEKAAVKKGVTAEMKEDNGLVEISEEVVFEKLVEEHKQVAVNDEVKEERQGNAEMKNEHHFDEMLVKEEVIVEMEAPHFDVASRSHLEVSDARSFVSNDVEGDSGFFDEADFDGFVSEEGRFIIEPVGSHLELIEDLFVTF